MISNILSKTLAVAAITGLSVMSAPAAFAESLVPQEEIEVEVGLGCLEVAKCLTDLSAFGIESITSLVNVSNDTASRLFIDTLETANGFSSDDPVFNNDVFLKDKDVGTNPIGFVYRPSTDEEQGQLEVGTFEIVFSEIIPELEIAFLDVEKDDTTAVLDVVGEGGSMLGAPEFIPDSGNDSIVTRTYKGVKSIILQLGFDDPDNTGDGVSFTLTSVPVPEPGAIVGLSAVAAGMMLKRRKSSQA